MRVSEKTLELTICSQLSIRCRPWLFEQFPLGLKQPLWFGLTQKQEAKAGFDAATKIGSSRLLLLQFKAGRRLTNGSVKFSASHNQLKTLRSQVDISRSVLYVLPTVTQTLELAISNRWVLDSTWFLDVNDIPVLDAPNRKSGCHSMYLNPNEGLVEIRSNPVQVNVISAEFLIENIGGRYVGAVYNNFDVFWKYARLFKKNAVAAALP